MALANHTRPAPFGAIATFSFISRIEAAMKLVADWNTTRKTQNILSNLSDRELADIGLTRGDIADLPARF